MRNKKTNRPMTSGVPLVLGYLGIFLFLIGALNLFPLLMLFFYPEESDCWPFFFIPSICYIAIGLLLYFLFLYKRNRARFARYENSQLLMLAWINAVLSGALPFFLAYLFGKMDMDFSESIFEASSAYSTTGLTVFKDYLDIDGAFSPHVYCFHRSFMQFIGGVGLVLVLESVLASSSTTLYASEGHSDKLLPSIGRSARLIFTIYSGYTLFGTLLLFLSGMDFFDAINHSMCALSGGGMSTYSTNVAYFSSSKGNGILPANPIAIEIILMLLVILSGISFFLHTFILRFKIKKFARDDEVRFAFSIMVIASLLMAFSGTMNLANSSGTSFSENFAKGTRQSVFYVIASATTSGFANTSLSEMLALGKPLLWTCTILMIIGGGAGSCGGGIKQYRVAIALKDLWYSLKYRFTPSHQINPRTTYRYGKLSPLNEDTVKEAHGYSLLFIIVFAISVLILTFLPEFDAEEAAFDVASAMSNTGLAATDFVSYGNNHLVAYPIALWTLSAGMILGRLEIMPLFYALRNIEEEFSYFRHRKNLEKEKLGYLDDEDE